MPIFARWRRLSDLPTGARREASPGVYEVADAGRRVIYVGQSSRDVPDRLRQHLSEGACVAQAGVFWRMETTRIPRAREAELLAAYARRHGSLPACNRARPLERDARRRWVERSS